jgi:phosphoribosylcarboxyaminoimidazole (NCAIR) mutase
MAEYMVLGMGSPSDVKAFEREYESLGSKTVDSYLEGKGILRLKDGPLQVSCHRTLDRAIGYAREVEGLEENHQGKASRVVLVLFGGMSFALPGIMASEMPTVPVIGVPAYSGSTYGGGLDSATAVYNLPPGTVVAGAPLHSDEVPSLDTAVLIAEKILRLNLRRRPVLICPDEDEKSLKTVRKILDRPETPGRIDASGGFHIDYEEQRKLGTDCPSIALNIYRKDEDILWCDRASSLALQCKLPVKAEDRLAAGEAFACTMEELMGTKNTLYFGRPENAALFLARVVGMLSPSLRSDLRQYRRLQEAAAMEKYGDRRSIKRDQFV